MASEGRTNTWMGGWELFFFFLNYTRALIACGRLQAIFNDSFSSGQLWPHLVGCISQTSSGLNVREESEQKCQENNTSHSAVQSSCTLSWSVWRVTSCTTHQPQQQHVHCARHNTCSYAPLYVNSTATNRQIQLITFRYFFRWRASL